jgi:hypothetical protein
MSERVIGYRLFVDGVTRPVFKDQDGQYVIGDYGEIVYGDWLVSSEQEADTPVVVSGRRRNDANPFARRSRGGNC